MGCGGSKKQSNTVDLNLSSIAPNSADAEVMASLNSLTGSFQATLNQFQTYQGSGQLIREAIGTPNEQTERAAWEAVRVGVMQLRDFFELSNTAEAVLPRVFGTLTGNQAVGANVMDHLEVVNSLFLLFDFCFNFDALKMNNPGVQNDLAYYRRVLSRLRRERKAVEGEIKDDVVDRMSLFYAYSNPMSKIVIDTTSTYINSDGAQNALMVSNVIACIGNSCLYALQENRITDSNMQLLYLRGMTFCTLILDHILPTGVFGKKSPVDIVGIIKLLKTWKAHNTDNLVNALMFMTAHVRDQNVIAFVKKNLWN